MVTLSLENVKWMRCTHFLKVSCMCFDIIRNKPLPWGPESSLPLFYFFFFFCQCYSLNAIEINQYKNGVIPWWIRAFVFLPGSCTSPAVQNNYYHVIYFHFIMFLWNQNWSLLVMQQLPMFISLHNETSAGNTHKLRIQIILRSFAKLPL